MKAGEDGERGWAVVDEQEASKHRERHTTIKANNAEDLERSSCLVLLGWVSRYKAARKTNKYSMTLVYHGALGTSPLKVKVSGYDSDYVAQRRTQKSNAGGECATLPHILTFLTLTTSLQTSRLPRRAGQASRQPPPPPPCWRGPEGPLHPHLLAIRTL